MENLLTDIIDDTDSYKSSQAQQDPPGTESSFSYISARRGHYDKCLFYAALPMLLERLSTKITVEMVEQARDEFIDHGEPFPYEGWMYIAQELGGRIPLHIRAIPEGTVVPTGTPVMTIRTTDPIAPWMDSWMETMLVRGCWYPSTVATRSWHIKGIIYNWLKKTSDDPDQEINFKLHDFGSRGVSSRESAMIGGSAHLINFLGTDTKVCTRFIKKYYEKQMAGFSIPASQHSTMGAWGINNERGAMENMVIQFGKPESILACVSDTYNIYRAVEDIWCSDSMQDMIKSRKCTVVIRPDSGNPPVVVNRVLDILDKKIGMTRNTKGFKVLPSHMRVIQGDGIDESSIEDILATIARSGYSASNIAFGMGGALLQKLDRDTMSWAQKRSAVKINGAWEDVWKDPVEDSGKTSLRGMFDVDQDFIVKPIDHPLNVFPNTAMRTVFLNGTIHKMDTWDTIRDRAQQAHMKRFL